MADKKTLTYRSNGKNHKLWIAHSTATCGCFLVEAFKCESKSTEGKPMCAWSFKAYTYRDGGSRISFRDKRVDGEFVENLRVWCGEGETSAVVAMAESVAKAVREQSVYLKRNRPDV